MNKLGNRICKRCRMQFIPYRRYQDKCRRCINELKQYAKQRKKGEVMADQPSKESLERARLIVEKYFDGPLEDHCKWGHELWVLVALEFDAIIKERKKAAFQATVLGQQNAALVSALRGALKAADELMTEFISKRRAAKWDVINDGLYKAERALAPYVPAEAEAKEKP